LKQKKKDKKKEASLNDIISYDIKCDYSHALCLSLPLLSNNKYLSTKFRLIMATSSSLINNSATSFSRIDLSLNDYPDDENSSSPSLIVSILKRDRNRLIVPLQTITTDNTTTESNDDGKNFEEDQLLTSYYDYNRTKQERLLSITNIFRLLIIFILGPIIYFIV